MPHEFSRIFMLLQHEADLAEGSLSIGLTSLRNATVADKRQFYTGFFNITIAFERLMKLIVVVDHMLSNEFVPPTRQELKSYGHDLVTLYQSTVGTASRNGIPDIEMPELDSLEYSILQLFSDFAKYARYYNLDSLQNNSTADTDPLNDWEAIIDNVVKNDVPSKKLKKQLAEVGCLVELIEEHTLSINSGMSGEPLTLLQAFSLPEKQSIAAPYLMVRVFNLLAPIIETVSELGQKGFYTRAPNDSGPHVPLFHETLVYFKADNAQIRRKKRWP